MNIFKHLPNSGHAHRAGLALTFFTIALVARLTLISSTTGTAFVTFYPAIILSFYFCGALYGSIVALSAGVAGIYFFMLPAYGALLNPNLITAAIFFSITSTLIGVFISRLHNKIRELDIILNNEIIAIMLLENRVITWCNKATSTLLGYSNEELIGKSTKSLYVNMDRYEEVGQVAYPLIKAGKMYRTHYEMIKSDGSKIWVDMNGSKMSDDGHTTLWLFSDITKIKQLEAELLHQVSTDCLTGLCSRSWFMSQALKEHSRTLRYDHPLSLLMLDIDFFKSVNDKYGHQSGDLVLKMVADSFKKCLRDTDICGRLGGEEFAILLPETNTEKALEIANRLLSAIAATQISLPKSDTKLQVTISIGLTSLTSKQDSIDLLISKADKALYEAKKTGRNRVCSTLALT